MTTQTGSGTGTAVSALPSSVVFGRCYCTLAELLEDLELNGPAPSEAAMMRHIKRASQYVDKWVGQFIPTTQTRNFDGIGEKSLFVDPCLAITSLSDDSDAITATQYLLYPRNRHWENGPYTQVVVDPDATELSCFTNERDSVSIVGRWGKYEKHETTGSTVANTTSIAADGTSLVVANGSLICPGMVLLIESEQLLVEATGTPTDSTANVNETFSAADETLTVTDGTKVYAGEILKVDNEQMKVLSISGNDLSVVRGWAGTAKATHSSTTDVYAYRTYTVTRGVNGTTAAAHLNAVAISRYLPPYDVNWLCVQIAGLMHMKARSKFAGKVGNADMGETFYFNEFGASIKEVRRNYRLVQL